MNWLILIGNDHSQTIENAELARKRAQVLSELHPYPYTIIQGSDLAPSSRAWTRIICLLILPGSITTMPPFLTVLYWQTRKQQHPLYSAACSFSRVPIFPKTDFKALLQIGPSSSRLMRHGVVRMPSSYPESLCSPSLPPTSDNCTGHCKALAPA